jgi:hypothetical protein
MKIKKIFYYEESPYHPGKYMITLHHDQFYCFGLPSSGSYHILQARLMNLSYAQYLRMCRDLFGAEIIGKKTMYPVAYFDNLSMVNKLLEYLNTRASYVLFLKEHPELNDEDIIKNARKILIPNYLEEKKNVHND